MNNEEKILLLLEAINARLGNLEADVSAIKEDIEVIREDSAEVRTTVNQLADWAERAESVTKVKLLPNMNQG